VRGGQLRLIGVCTPKRLPQFADVQTIDESGLPGLFFNSWFAIVAPAGTPKAIVARLNAEILKVLSDPVFGASLMDWAWSCAAVRRRSWVRSPAISLRNMDA